MSLEYPVSWRLRQCMQAAGITSVTELHEKIRKLDPDSVKYAQLARMIDSPPARLNLKTLTLLTVALSCRVSDILDVGPDTQLERS